MITRKNYPMGDKNGATQTAEKDINLLVGQGYKIISTNTAVIRPILSGKPTEIIMLTLILEQ